MKEFVCKEARLGIGKKIFEFGEIVNESDFPKEDKEHQISNCLNSGFIEEYTGTKSASKAIKQSENAEEAAKIMQKAEKDKIAADKADAEKAKAEAAKAQAEASKAKEEADRSKAELDAAIKEKNDLDKAETDKPDPKNTGKTDNGIQPNPVKK